MKPNSVSSSSLGGSLIQVDSEVDLSYFKKMLDQSKSRLEELSFIEQRAALVNNDTSLEGTNYLI